MLDVGARFDEAASGGPAALVSSAGGGTTSAAAMWSMPRLADSDDTVVVMPARIRSASASSVPMSSTNTHDDWARAAGLDGAATVSFSSWSNAAARAPGHGARRASLSSEPSLFTADMHASLPRIEETGTWSFEQRPRSKTVDAPETDGPAIDFALKPGTLSHSSSTLSVSGDWTPLGTHTRSTPTGHWTPSLDDSLGASRRRSASVPAYRDDDGVGGVASSRGVQSFPPVMLQQQTLEQHQLLQQQIQMFEQQQQQGGQPPWRGERSPPTNDVSAFWSVSMRQEVPPAGHHHQHHQQQQQHMLGSSMGTYDIEYAYQLQQQQQQQQAHASMRTDRSPLGFPPAAYKLSQSLPEQPDMAHFERGTQGYDPRHAYEVPSGGRPRADATLMARAPVMYPEPVGGWLDGTMEFDGEFGYDDGYGGDRGGAGEYGDEMPARQMTSARGGSPGAGELPRGVEFYRVEFKNGRTGSYYVEDLRRVKFKVGDLVLVEADRGKDLGRVVGRGPEMAEKDAKPICRLAHPPETAQMALKAQDEAKALALCQAKCRQKKLPMEVVDAEYQWDRRKLTYYFVADRRIDFRELVRELFKVYKTRIWMCSVESPGKRTGAVIKGG